MGRLFGFKLFTDFERILKENSYKIKRFKKGMLTHLDLSGYNVLLLGAPTKEITPDEINAITDFVAKGGGLLLLAQAQDAQLQARYNEMKDKMLVGWIASKFMVNLKSLNQLALEFGIKFSNETISAGRNSMKSFGQTFPVITQFSPHPILQGVNELIISGGAPIQGIGETYGIAFSDSDTIPPNSVVLAANQVGKGRVVALASPSPFTRIRMLRISQPYGLHKPDHVLLTMNLINWLSHRIA